jgi:pimeloyl-ACP methyl ester carboxylesterase
MVNLHVMTIYLLFLTIRKIKGNQMTFTSKFTIVLSLVMLSFVFCVGAQAQNRNPELLQKWVKEGSIQKINGHDIFVHASGKAPVEGHGVLIVHGYPGSSWDFSNVVPQVAKKTKVVVIDMLGFGQSDKPLDGTFKQYYSLMKQADLYEAVAKAQGLKEVVLVAHDMGQTVGLELMTRHDEGKLSFKIRHAILLDGSTLVDMVELAEMQKKLLKLPVHLHARQGGAQAAQQARQKQRCDRAKRRRHPGGCDSRRGSEKDGRYGSGETRHV